MTPECSTHRQAGRRGARLPQVLLLLSGLAGCGYATQEEETLRTTRQALAPERCVVESPFTPGFQPELAWERRGGPDGSDAFTHVHVRMMPVVVDVSGDGVPDIVFIASRGLGSLGDGRSFDDALPKGTFSGILRAFSGDDGRELWSVTDTQHRVRGLASLAAGDIDGDGLVELCTVPVDGLGVSCFENDGTFKFRTTNLEGGSLPFNEWGGPALADLDGDGAVEILVGNHVFTSTGETKWVGSEGAGPEKGALPFAVDIDQDGTLEVVNGRAVYRHDGTLRCANLDIGRGLSAVADFDGDGRGEIVVSWGGSVTLLDDDCSLRWTKGIPGGNIPGSGERSGPPTIADVDGDGQPEIAVAGAYQLAIFEADGSIRWQQPIQTRIRMSGATAFDFEGDGRTELVYADGQYLRIYEGATGAVRFMAMNSSSRVYDTSMYESGIPYELPVVADLDADGRADLLVASSSYGLEQSSRPGLRVFHDRNEGWVGARRIWNQNAYSVVNINDDGTVPALQGHGWLTPENNTFRVNARVDASALPAADLQVVALSAGCVEPDSLATQQLHLEARVRNAGEAPVPAGVQVAFYTGAPATGGTLLGTTALSQSLAAQAEEVVTLTFAPALDDLHEVWAVVDDGGGGSGQVTECIEDNNTASTPVSGCSVPNLPPVALCRNVTVAADATCQASASVDDGSYDPDDGPGPLSLTSSPAGPYGLGSHVVTLTASDGEASDTCSATVTVLDVTPPTPGADRKLVLRPPDHTYTPVRLSECAMDAQDACGGTLPIDQYGHITHVTSDEPEDSDGTGDGRTCQDALLSSTPGTTSVQLRAEREGTSDGRVYTLHYVVTDPSGNTASGTCTVHVPHDWSRTPAVDSGPKYCVGEGCPADVGDGPLCTR